MSQKAASAKRCIKTQRGRQRHRRSFPRVRKHRAPKGALRPAELVPCALAANQFRKHRAPKGALRAGQALPDALERGQVRKHRAPKGALRHAMRGLAGNLVPVRKHRAPKGALRPKNPLVFGVGERGRSESTERQKVH